MIMPVLPGLLRDLVHSNDVTAHYGILLALWAVAGAYIADITDGDERARHFGFMSACFGFGMVAGPVLGGLMGGFSPHAPFFAAAALNGLNFLTGCFLLPESHKG
ncbi:MFS transporter, partial [Klebsiella pneumoniae]|uniref:MFS transporter n=1 Tax=Klebsiella pneumoniae TaxID=573 RepID=UPI00209A7E82